MEQELTEFGFNILFTVIQWIIALTLISRAKKNKINTLYLLAIAIFLEGFSSMVNVESPPIFLLAFIPMNIAVWSHIIFIKLTFYKDRKSPISILLAIIIPISVLQWILSGIHDIGLNKSFLMFFFGGRLLFSILQVITYGWLAYSFLKTYLKTRNNKMLEPWVKARYLLIITYASAKLVVGLLMPFSPITITPLDWIFIPMAVAAFTVMPSLFLAWVMPKGLKKWLNRNFIIKEEEIFSEEELMKQLEER
ncbi:MAG: hypothetical protein ACFFAS_18345 [Promethearchaeota archaeon]